MSKVPTVHLPVAELDARLAALARAENRLTAEAAAQDEQVLAVRQRHADTINALANEVERLRTQLDHDAICSREQLLAGVDGKTVRTIHGEISYRRQPAKALVPAGAARQAAVIDALKARDLLAYVRVREEIDRQTLTAAIQTTDDTAFLADLEACGLQIVGGHDEVLIKPNHEIVRAEADGHRAGRKEGTAACRP